jgi:hypothetical protein
VSSKRKRKRRPSSPQDGAGKEAKSTTEAQAEEPRRGAVRAGLPPSPFPPLGISLARGLRVLGSSPVVLATAFLSLLASSWAFVALGVELTPRFLVVAMAISPAHLFTDVPVAFSPTDVTGLLASVAGLAILRSVTFSLLIALIAQGLDGVPDFRAAVRRIGRPVLTVLAIYLLEVGLVVVVLQLFAAFLGQFAPLVVAASIYFLAFVPVVAVMENTSLRTAFGLGTRAARLPGLRHMSLVLLYYVVLSIAAAISPVLAPATPSVLTWAFGLAMTFVHVGVLGALVFRWKEVRDQVTSASAPPGTDGA